MVRKEGWFKEEEPDEISKEKKRIEEKRYIGNEVYS
jgi:hypothetical protein